MPVSTCSALCSPSSHFHPQMLAPSRLPARASPMKPVEGQAADLVPGQVDSQSQEVRPPGSGRVLRKGHGNSWGLQGFRGIWVESEGLHVACIECPGRQEWRRVILVMSQIPVLAQFPAASVTAPFVSLQQLHTNFYRRGAFLFFCAASPGETIS